MRGKGKEPLEDLARKGITPAHAGKRSLARWHSARNRDHPRTCGEKACQSAPQSPITGSPPHMRGKVARVVNQLLVPGITPAHAGKRRPAWRWRRPRRDHPRTCGEKVYQIFSNERLLGSPPHMRGKDGRGWPDRLTARITPAHAGKRHMKDQQTRTFRDHPRTCGEKTIEKYHEETARGSPPHMRGKDSGSNEI